MKAFTIIILACCLSIACQKTPTTSKVVSKLIGSWNWVKSYYHTQDTSFVWTNIVGRLIITEKDYSIMFIDQGEPRILLEKVGWDNNTKEDLEKALRKFIANGGRYEFKNDSLFCFREIAIWPNNMLPEKQPSKYKVEWAGDTLILVTTNSRESWLKRN